jgi:hypothetical protein
MASNPESENEYPLIFWAKHTAVQNSPMQRETIFGLSDHVAGQSF